MSEIFSPFDFPPEQKSTPTTPSTPTAPKSTTAKQPEHFTSDFNFESAEDDDIYIKVVGVGGGGGNAVNHMYDEGIHDVSFAVCNTDAKALKDSPVPFKLQLGKEGLGAGNRPEKGRAAVEESIDQVKQMFNDGTKMVFITAGMGGGTGTGAAPIIARMAMDLDILTVGIVTIPFKWEGIRKIDQALDGVEEMRKNVDALLVVNNERLREIYPNKSLTEAFDIADDTLCNAAKSISGIITMHGRINLDFRDVRTILKDGGVAIINSGEAAGDGRVKRAIAQALESPLLKDKEFFRSRKVLLHMVEPGPTGSVPLMMDEIKDIDDLMNQMTVGGVETKWGHSYDPSLQDKVRITILASGFDVKDIDSEELVVRIGEREAEAQRLKMEEEMRQQQLEERRNEIYGSNSKSGLLSRSILVHIFDSDDLDNDDLISAVESAPTAQRTKSTLSQLTRNRHPKVALQGGDTINLSE